MTQTIDQHPTARPTDVDLPAFAAQRRPVQRARLALPPPQSQAVTLRRPPDGVIVWQASCAVGCGSMIWFVPLLLVSAAVNFINFTGSPQRIDDEGTYTAQAYAVDKLGELTHYTYWYDHPPLGWIQIAGWTKLTDGFARYTSAVMAGREFMIVCALVSCALLWMLARRLDMSRPAAAVAVFIFAISPLAVQFHRTVFLDNVATPWLLAAFVLALAPRRQLTRVRRRRRLLRRRRADQGDLSALPAVPGLADVALGAPWHPPLHRFAGRRRAWSCSALGYVLLLDHQGRAGSRRGPGQPVQRHLLPAARAGPPPAACSTPAPRPGSP